MISIRKHCSLPCRLYPITIQAFRQGWQQTALALYAVSNLCYQRGFGVAGFLYGLSFFFGETVKSFLIVLYWGPITAVFIFIGMLFFQMPRAMKLPKGPFAFYLMFVTLPVLGLGALILWSIFGGN